MRHVSMLCGMWSAHRNLALPFFSLTSLPFFFLTSRCLSARIPINDSYMVCNVLCMHACYIVFLHQDFDREQH